MERFLCAVSSILVLSCSYPTRVHITGFIQDYDPGAVYDIKLYDDRNGGIGFPDSLEVEQITGSGWFALNPDSSSTSPFLGIDSAQFRVWLADSPRILATFKPWVDLRDRYLIDDKGTRYYFRSAGHGKYFLDNLRIGPPKTGP